ncbi:MAG: DJ-1/PfpI family protein [Lachnospira sp.]|nr:DJ-1/PfpI family protein [Lachnospira sp.]
MKVTTFLTDGFETVEALAVVDVLRRAKIDVELVSITGSVDVLSAQKIAVQAEKLIENCQFEDSDVLFLPGGPGHTSYLACEKLVDALNAHNVAGKRIAAICAAPSVLGKLGMLKGKSAVAFPGFEDDLIGAEVKLAPVRVVTDGNITTSRGMGTSIDLGLELVRLLVGEELAESLRISTQYV